MRGSDSVYPTVPKNLGYDGSDGTGSASGIDLRTYLAAMAMQGLLSDGSYDVPWGAMAVDAVRSADALIAELGKS